jgi:hypothetical protein
MVISLFLLSVEARAQASRTWVSGLGDDANPCSRTAPCKTFAGAISKTIAGGEIDALDPGGFGAVTITKAITIDGGGQIASVLASGTNGIVVQVGTNDVVTLRNLQLNGIRASGNGGLNGVLFLSGSALHVDNCNIFGFTQNAINAASTTNSSQLTINNTFLTNNNNGVLIAPTSGVIRATLINVRSHGNASSGVRIAPAGGLAGSLIANSSVLLNGTGISMTGGTLVLSNSEVAANDIGLSISGGSPLSSKNNLIIGNGVDGTPIPGTPLN